MAAQCAASAVVSRVAAPRPAKALKAAGAAPVRSATHRARRVGGRGVIRATGAPKDEDGLVRVRFFGTGESCKVRSTSKEVRPWEGELSFVGEALRAKLPEKKKALVAKWELALREARGEVEQGTPDSEPEQDINWSTEGHDFLNARVALAHEKPKGGKRVFLGTIVKWAPPDADAGDQALFHVRHDDGDSEDLEDYEVEAAMEMYKEQPEHIRKEAKAVKDAVRRRRRRRAILGAILGAQFSACAIL